MPEVLLKVAEVAEVVETLGVGICRIASGS